jgi:sporulation protein YlmC with PRC-barrel domain
MTLQQTPTARTVSFSKDVIGKEVIDSSGFKAGRIRDIAIRFVDGCTQIAGVVVHNRFVPWNTVKSFGADLYINVRWFAIGAQPVPSDSLLVCQQMLGEQLLDQHGRTIGHVDDIGMVWDAASKQLSFDHVLTGPYLSIGLPQGSKQISWQSIVGIKQKPRAIVVKKM